MVVSDSDVKGVSNRLTKDEVFQLSSIMQGRGIMDHAWVFYGVRKVVAVDGNV